MYDKSRLTRDTDEAGGEDTYFYEAERFEIGRLVARVEIGRYQTGVDAGVGDVLG